MNADTERLRIAEHAAAWLVRLETATPEEHMEFKEWLRQSELHVIEFLAAKATHDELAQVFKDTRFDTDAFVRSADSNVRDISTGAPFRDASDVPPTPRATDPRPSD